MVSKKKSTSPTTQIHSGDKGVSVGRDIVDSVIATGDNTTINQTFVQKVYNFFKPDTESLDQRNRRILLNHVENFWVKGVLEKSLHGAAMLELGIKEDPAAITYPWAIKKESTDETLPTGMSMLEIFEQIGMGRSLLILGAPGSGKSTMLYELARQLIKRARQNADEPIPMVFNLASWTEKLSLADWLAQELNNIYYVPRKTAPDWVKGNKLLLLLDGLDEVRQESRSKCVDAINGFRKEHGLTSLAVCSRSQDYEELGAKLAFDGAIEVLPLTQKQVNEFFNRFGKELAGLKSVLKKDSALREMAETPLFLSIMVIAYRDVQDVEVLVSQDLNTQRKNLFDNYIEQMFEHQWSKSSIFNRHEVLSQLTWLAQTLIKHNALPFLIEKMQTEWLFQDKQKSQYQITLGTSIGCIVASAIWLIFGYAGFSFGTFLAGIGAGLITGVVGIFTLGKNKIQTVDLITWRWRITKDELFSRLISGCLGWLIISGIIGFSIIISSWIDNVFEYLESLNLILVVAITGITTGLLKFGLITGQVEQKTNPGQGLLFSLGNFLRVFIIAELLAALLIFLINAFGSLFIIGYTWDEYVSISIFRIKEALLLGLIPGLGTGLFYGGFSLIQHFSLRFVMNANKILSFRVIPFLDYCTDLIFLRRVGGGYIFVHRLLMEHFAAMYKEESDQRIGSGLADG